MSHFWPHCKSQLAGDRIMAFSENCDEKLSSISEKFLRIGYSE